MSLAGDEGNRQSAAQGSESNEFETHNQEREEAMIARLNATKYVKHSLELSEGLKDIVMAYTQYQALIEELDAQGVEVEGGMVQLSQLYVRDGEESEYDCEKLYLQSVEFSRDDETDEDEPTIETPEQEGGVTNDFIDQLPLD